MSVQEQPSQALTMPEIVAANIRAETARRGMSQLELSMALGVSQSAISRRWSGSRQWQLEDLDAVAAVLGLEPWELTRPPVTAGGRSWYTARDSNPEPIDSPTRRGGAEVIDLATRRRLGRDLTGVADAPPPAIGQ